MAGRELAARDHYTSGTIGKRMYNELWVDAARAHDPDDPDIRWVLEP